MPAPPELKVLIEKFNRNYKQYSSQEYKEAELRKEFIDPLFELLGWDMANKQEYAEQYKEVKYEPSLEVEGGTKAPDYAFRLGGKTIFFVEAKKPSVDINFDKLPAFQLKRYAWSQNIPLSILTNFEYIAVYDGRFKPNKNDEASAARIMKSICYEDLEKRWDAIANVFSRDAVLKGSFDHFAEDTKGLRGTSVVNEAFLEEIEQWREMLAKNIALRNQKLETEELNFAVQKIIDRIIFLRMCEDRGTEPQDQIHKIAKKSNIYRRLVDLFELADAKYNSGVFHFHIDNKRATHPDELTPNLKMDDEVLLKIIKNLYYPDSPYQFDVISADILGQVYEQFLGKIIRLTEGHHAKVEEKPEVKKAGGVYYTPTYIVHYIVETTVGKLCKDKPPNEMEKLHILDPSCGSGSFLIVAYERLLKEHLDWYITNDPKKWKDAVFQGSKGEWRLTLHEKKRILLNNIYGVDLDGQAVEVTKLNLLLKALEGESKESIENMNKWFREPALPDLGNNIKCGNSLVDFDVQEILKNLPQEEQENEFHRIKPFSWNSEFPNILKNGGFDAVIGNPPYVRQETLGANFKEYAQKHFSTYAGTADLYAYFIEKGISLIQKNGLYSIIVANKWMRANYGAPLRKWLAGKHIIEIIDFGDLPVFKTATTYPCILTVIGGEATQTFDASVIKTLEPNRLAEAVRETRFSVTVDKLDEAGWALVGVAEEKLLWKLKTTGKPLNKYVEGKILRGIITGLNEAFVIDDNTRKQLTAEDMKSADLIKPFLIGKDVKRYAINEQGRYLITIPSGWTRANMPPNSDARKWFFSTYPAIAKHLSNYEEAAKVRCDVGEYWWELRACVYYSEFQKSKILYPDISQSNNFTFDTNGYFCTNSTYFIPTDDKYLLGILDSSLMEFVVHRTSPPLRGGYYRFFSQYIEQLPIRTLDLSNAKEKAQHDRMVTLVERMLKLHKDLENAKTPDAKTQFQRTIDATDKEINALVYDLYGLTKEEINIIEK